MVPWYQRLSRDLPRAVLHYLSSSPIQLYHKLKAFVAAAGFPSGSMHLRESTSWRSVVVGSDTSMKRKRGALSRLLTQRLRRHFVLVGDSGERNPKIYAEIARSHPQQVTAIAIRDVTGEYACSPRYHRVFEGISPERWVVTSPEAMGKWPVGL